VHFEQGRTAYREGALVRARAELQRANELAPSPELEFNLGRVCERLGEARAAIEHFERYLGQAKVAASERQGIEARIRTLRAQIERQRPDALFTPPSNAALTAEARAFFERGIKLYQQRQYSAALAAFSAARRFTALPELSYNLALCCERLGRNAEAVDHYRAYLREADHPPDAASVQAKIRSLLAADPRQG
jgi:tetratricopeptide (TPR) repeat protein